MILGSGFLSVKVSTDGPTRVLQISDVKNKVRWVVSLHMNIMFKSTNNTFFSVNARIGLSQLSLLRDHCVWSSHVHNTPLQCVGVLSVYLATILYYHWQLFFDAERENIPCSIYLCFTVRDICYN